ncbi:uncharacterized protein [Acropora muricata]|uniref:uncharacterized protein isoform X2 n=1 Tax=Acropora muricata TaxID=159855 RepID=UPI0034E4A2F7
MAPNFLALATTLENLGARWLLAKKVNCVPWSIMFLTGVAGCLFYERFIEEPDETGTRDPLITRLMIEYLMPDPETEQQKRNEHLRLMRERCDAYLELKRKPNLGLQPFDIEYIEKDIQRAPEFGPDHY